MKKLNLPEGTRVYENTVKHWIKQFIVFDTSEKRTRFMDLENKNSGKNVYITCPSYMTAGWVVNYPVTRDL